jgi:hypothetical protein
MTHQNGYTMANLSARKQFDEGTIRTIGANLSRAISGDTGDDKTLSGGAYAQFDTRYASGTLNVNSGVDGYVNTNLTASGSVGWQGKNIAASGRTDGNAGVIFNTGLEDDGKLSARVNGRISSSAASVTTCRSRRTAAMKWSCRTAKTRSTATTSSAGVRVI